MAYVCLSPNFTRGGEREGEREREREREGEREVLERKRGREREREGCAPSVCPAYASRAANAVHYAERRSRRERRFFST